MRARVDRTQLERIGSAQALGVQGTNGREAAPADGEHAVVVAVEAHDAARAHCILADTRNVDDEQDSDDVIAVGHRLDQVVLHKKSC